MLCCVFRVRCLAFCVLSFVFVIVFLFAVCRLTFIVVCCLLLLLVHCSLFVVCWLLVVGHCVRFVLCAMCDAL